MMGDSWNTSQREEKRQTQCRVCITLKKRSGMVARKVAAQLQPASVRLEQCRSFIERAKKRISDLEAEKAI